VFLTDVQASSQCSSCTSQVAMPVDALASTVLRLYGPRAGGQVSQGLLSSYSFLDLLKFLNGVTTAPDEKSSLESDLSLTDWVVVSMLKPNASQPETLAFQRLLSERPDLLRNKKIIVFAFNAPYYLDATDISKLSAYYGLYSKTAPFVDVAARILFQELVPAGALPVSVSGIGYDLIYSTSPDPNQVIPLIIDSSPETPSLTPVTTQEPTPAPVFRVGDLIPLRTGIIVDHNNNPVPDGTPVQFNFSVISESSGSTSQQVETQTTDGVARYMYRIERPGLLEIHASSEQGARSNLLRLDITSGVSAGITMVAPTSEPTVTLTPTPTVTVTVTPTPTQTPVPPVTVGFQDWFAAFLIAIATAAAVAWFGIRQAITRWGLRWALCGLIGGMIAYNYLALGLPGSEAFLQEAGTRGILVVTVMGIMVGWIAGLIWRQIVGPSPRSQDERAASGATGPKSQSG
jgi:beta-N-acetylhexosaminidase